MIFFEKNGLKMTQKWSKLLSKTGYLPLLEFDTNHKKCLCLIEYFL